jgi:hypothetical protein
MEIDLVWVIVILVLSFFVIISLFITQIRMSKLKNPYYGIIIPFLSSVTMYFLVSTDQIILYLIPFGIYMLTYLIARYNYKSKKTEKVKVDIKDL